MKFVISLFTAFLMSGLAMAASWEDDVARYVAIFSGDTSGHNDAVETLAWMGISSPRVYDLLERRLLNEAQGAKTSKEDKNRVARYIRALGFSGQTKYTQTISKYVGDKVYERYASTALEDLRNYQKWNPVIANRATFDPQYSDDVNRIRNMLKSDDMQLKRIGAKRIYFANQDDILLEVLSKELQTNYQKAEGEDIDAVAWMVKALGHAKNPKYRPLIEEIAIKAKDKKVVKYARLALES
jgi:hypothetical protein